MVLQIHDFDEGVSLEQLREKAAAYLRRLPTSRLTPCLLLPPWISSRQQF